LGRHAAAFAHPDRGRPVRGRRPVGLQRPPVPARRQGNRDAAGKPYEAKFEFDLYGTNVDAGQTTFRLRHIYASWGPFLAGQTNSLFMDGDIFPNVIDYWGPTGMVFVRNPQIRWTFLNRNGWTAAVALEHPERRYRSGQHPPDRRECRRKYPGNEELPDLTAAVRYGGDWGHVRLAGILRKIGYDTRERKTMSPTAGDRLGRQCHLRDQARHGHARLGVVYGRGIATYMNDGGMDLAPAVSSCPCLRASSSSRAPRR
jgi:hypothetical protein